MVGDPYLVSQLEPEPSGRSPVEEVLSASAERTSLLEEREDVLTRLGKIDEEIDGRTELSTQEEGLIASLEEELSGIERKLSAWEGSDRTVARILAGLGFHSGVGPALDGAPSMYVKDEVGLVASSLGVGSVVEVRDKPEEEW